MTKKTIGEQENSLEDDPALRAPFTEAEALLNSWRAEAVRTAEALQATFDSMRISLPTASGIAGMLVRTAARETLERTDLADEERHQIEGHLARFEQDFEALLAAKDQSADHAFNAIIIAVILGTHIGDEGDSRFRAAIVRSLAAAGGKASGESRRKNRPWVKHAEELAKAGRVENREISQDDLAAEIIAAWKMETPRSPGPGTLKKHISEMEHKGDLPRRFLG